MATSPKRPKFLHEILDDSTGETTFDHMPDEVQLKIFKTLEIKDLIRCAQVSKRTRRICHDESMWKKVNLYEKVVPSEFIEMILENGCKYLNLKSSVIVGSLNLSRNDYDVRYLNLSQCHANEGVLEKLISSCKSLQKLSLDRLSLNSHAMDSCKFQQLQTLDLHSFRGLDLELMKNILSFKTLTEVSFRNHPNKYNSDWLIQYFVENLSSDVEKVSLGGMTSLKDKHVKILVERCKKIKELELCGCRNITDDSLTSIVEHSDQMVKLDISKTNIGFALSWDDRFGALVKLPVQGRNPFEKVKSMPKLKVFNCQHPGRSKQDIANLRKSMPQIIINQGVYGGDLDIANPNESIKPEDGVWDIFVKRIELFPLAHYLVNHL
jgi:hypothetical protein